MLALIGNERTVSAMNGTTDATHGTVQPECYRLPAAGLVLGGVSRRLISNLIREGELTVTWVGSIRMVTAQSLRDYIKRHTDGGSQ